MNNRADETLQQRADRYCRERNNALDQLEELQQQYDAERRRRVAAEDRQIKTREEYDALPVTHKDLAIKFKRLQVTARLEAESTKNNLQRRTEQLEEANEALLEELKELTAWRKGVARQQLPGQPDWQGYKHTTEYHPRNSGVREPTQASESKSGLQVGVWPNNWGRQHQGPQARVDAEDKAATTKSAGDETEQRTSASGGFQRAREHEGQHAVAKRDCPCAKESEEQLAEKHGVPQAVRQRGGKRERRRRMGASARGILKEPKQRAAADCTARSCCLGPPLD